MKEAILFDLDGTLWDSSVQVVESWNEVFRSLEDVTYEITVEQIKGYMGKPMDEIAYHILPHVTKERALEIMKLCTDHENDYLSHHGGNVYAGVEKVLSSLAKKYTLAIVSNCQKGYIETFLEYHKLGQYIEDTEDFGRTGLQKGENIKLVLERNQIERAWYLGDTQGDADAAHFAGIPFIYAEYGFGSVKNFEAKIQSIDELEDCISLWK